MKKNFFGIASTIIVVIVLVVILVVLVVNILPIIGNPTTVTTTSIINSRKGNRVVLMVLVDNNVYDRRLETAWGISILVKENNTCILFDTGPSPEILLHNAQLLGVNFSCITSIVFSHEHGDHIGGIDALKSYSNNTTIYVPRGFPQGLLERLEQEGFNNIVIVNNTLQILDGIYVLKPLYGPPWEQALVIETGRGLVILTGCSHPGITRIVEEAVREFNQKPYIVVGGFHLIGEPVEKIRNIIEELVNLGVDKIYPLHCSGDLFRSILEREHPQRYGGGGVGLILDISG